jgi:hypothetical protein
VYGIAALHVTMADDRSRNWRPIEEHRRTMIGIVPGRLYRKTYQRRPVEAMDSIALKMLFGDRLDYHRNVRCAPRSKTGIIARPIH